MAINLKTHNQIQIVLFSGQISTGELKALKLKLSPTLSQGQVKLLLDVAQLDHRNKSNISAVVDLVEQVQTLKVASAVCGLTAATWSLYGSSSGKKMNKFYSQEEGLEFLLKAGSAFSQSNISEALSDAAPETIALIEQHEIKRTKKTYDPFRLEKIMTIYPSAPDRNHIKQLEHAVNEFSKVKNENTATNQELDQIAEQMLALTKLRKSAIHYDEISKRSEQLKKLIASATKETNDLNKQIQNFSAIALNYSEQAKLLPLEYQKKINELVNKRRK